jgi:2-oxoglutarate ferredoxin oxidoreductase subunit alpha
MARVLMKGTEAIAEAAIQAGCNYFFGYPITPQNEIPEYMSAKLPKIGGAYVQAESEVAAINMVMGGGSTGKKIMTTSSSPGISLMSEGISYIAGCEIPAVIVNVMRGGPGLGGILPSQLTTSRPLKAAGTATTVFSSLPQHPSGSSGDHTDGLRPRPESTGTGHDPCDVLWGR